MRTRGEMLELARATDPGPFESAHPSISGDYIGVIRDARLVVHGGRADLPVPAIGR